MRVGQVSKRNIFQWQHLVAWLGGMLCFFVPYHHHWTLECSGLVLRQGPGNFAFNLLAGIGVLSAGAVIGGYWWRLGSWLLGAPGKVMSVSAVLLLMFSLVGLSYEGVRGLYPYLVCGTLIPSLVFAAFRRHIKWEDFPGWNDLMQWLDKKYAANVPFFALLLAVLAINDFGLIYDMEAGWLQKMSIFAGRFLTHTFLVLLAFLWAELVMRSGPRYTCWVPWLVLALAPVMVILDQLLGVMWNRTLFDVVNALTSSGKLNLSVELQTSGLDVGPVWVCLGAMAVYLVALFLSALCWSVSMRFQMRFSTGLCIILMLVSWLGVVIEQGLGSLWKKIPVWQEERKQFDLHIGLFSPPRGLGTYEIVFHDREADYEAGPVSLNNKPDIYIFILESVRSDAIRRNIAPFMTQLRNEQCQPFDASWASSNATHLSWFGFFHSRVPVFWRQAQEQIDEREQFYGAYPLTQLREAGYEIEVRAVCDLGYKDFGFSNFGHGENLVHTLEQSRPSDYISKLGIAQREKVVMEKLRQSVLSRPQGGLYITALDSPHYNYYWHEEFDPPFKPYDEDAQFPMNPSKEEVQRVVNRYWNSVAWVDWQLRQFCEFLQSEGRYDESIIIITGDHGEEFQEQGSWFHCSSLRPEQIAVPILIKWPSSLGQGPICKDVNHMDVMPTLMHVLGFPDDRYQHLAGRNLWVGGISKTSISTTAYTGESRETMVLHRDGYEAVFYWDRYWESKVPGRVVLQKLTGPDGSLVQLRSAGAYADALKSLFPDAFDRFIESLEESSH
ncbi:MAG: sulfatase-like hydrolase/transferase [Akkermansiaceae bacterium]